MSQKLFLHEYCLDFKEPQLVGNTLLQQRKGILIACSSSKQVSEAAPLPGYSLETLETVKNELEHFKFPNCCLEKFTEILIKSSLSNASLFGLFSLALKQQPLKYPDAKISYRSYIDIPCFVPNWEQKILKKIEKSIDFNMLYIKIKMSSYTLDQTLHVLSLIKKRSFKNIQLHLDFNQKLTYEGACCLFQRFSKKDFFLIEDPVSDLDELKKLSDKFCFSLALDQTLRDHPWEQLAQLKNICCLMIKPTLSMRLLLDAKFLNWVKSNSAGVDLSSCYESPIGLACIQQLGCHLFETFSLGIDTEKLFTKPYAFFPSQEGYEGIFCPAS